MSDYHPTTESGASNPLSVELRIVLVYFWETYKHCLKYTFYEKEAEDCLLDVRNLCFDLFSPASPYSHVHIHSEYGCNDDSCPSWQWGFEAAKESVGDWYQPEPLYST